MIIYLFTFLTSILLILGAEKIDIYKTQSSLLNLSKVSYFLIILIALLLPSLLAGFRDYTIGTDVLVYGNTWFTNAVNTPNFVTYINWATSSSIGFLYATFNFIVARFTNNPHYFYFWYSFVETIIFFRALRKNSDIINVPFAMSIYYLLFFNLTLNLLRQSMALIILFYGFYYMRNNKPIKYLILIVIAYYFHSTAVIGVITYFVYVYANKKPRIIYQTGVVAITLIIILAFDNIQNFLLNSNMVDQRYSFYLNNPSLVRSGFYSHLILFCLPALIFYLKKSNIADDSVFYGLRMIVVVSTLLSLLNLKVGFLSRITLYFDVYFVFALSFIVDNGFQIKYKHIHVNKFIILLYAIIYWIIIYAVTKSGETVPYIFMTN